MNVLLLSPYDAMSHQHWRHYLQRDLEAADAAKVTTLTLPPRHFSWRFRGNSLTFAHDERLQQSFDLVIATSMTDLAALRGMQPKIARVPTVLYFHENQFAYPTTQFERQVERQITSIYSAIAADRLVFNSHFNRQTFLTGAAQLLGKMPDGVPDDLVGRLENKSQVICVPIPAATPTGKPDTFTLVWNHRWEYDKGLDDLLSIAEQVRVQLPEARWHIVGQGFRKVPPIMQTVQQVLGDGLRTFGFIESRADYENILQQSHLVLSTARQEFQGIAVLEAMARGCTPVVPDSLAYREFIPADQRYDSTGRAVALIERAQQCRQTFDLPGQVTAGEVQSGWRHLIRELVN